MSIKLSHQQTEAYDRIGKWVDSKEQEFVLAGYAGTGKSTIAQYVNNGLFDGDARFVAFTGKAANVLREKGNDASTLHSALYQIRKNKRIEELENLIKEETDAGKIQEYIKEIHEIRITHSQPGFVLNPDSVLKGANVIVDEYSMLSDSLLNDLRSMAKRILYLGDPFQLPPVNGVCSLTESYLLTDVHRQALESPILRAATDVRIGKGLEYTETEEFVYKPRSEIPAAAYETADQLIVGRNDTREAWNRRFRSRYGYGDQLLPQHGEKVICLKNAPEHDLFNGMILTTSSSSEKDEESYILSAFDHPTEWNGLNVWLGDIDGTGRKFSWHEHRDLHRFDFGYAITAHKSQGSEWDSVLIYNEPVGKSSIDCRKWLYTAITRAKKSVVLVDPKRR